MLPEYITELRATPEVEKVVVWLYVIFFTYEEPKIVDWSRVNRSWALFVRSKEHGPGVETLGLGTL